MVGTALIVGGPETVGAFVGSGMAPPPHMQHIAAEEKSTSSKKPQEAGHVS